MIGFDDLGGAETFTTKQLEDRLASQSSKAVAFYTVNSFHSFFAGIFQVFGKFKVSADRRDVTESAESDDDGDGEE